MNDISKVRVLLSSLLDGSLGAEDFCRQYENFWNFELNEDDVPEDLTGALRTLFEEVVLFSPFPREEWEYPGYRDEIEIRQAAEPVMKLMGISLLKEGGDA